MATGNHVSSILVLLDFLALKGANGSLFATVMELQRAGSSSAVNSVFKGDILKNPWLLGGLFVGVILQLLVIYWPPLSNFFHTRAIDYEQFIWIVIVSSLVLWVEEIRKLIARKKLRRKP